MSADMLTAVRCIVEGRVQGVFYRKSTADRARSLGLSGWVRNRPDGSVELVAVGEPRSVESLAAWLWEGPPAARVTAVTVAEFDGEVEDGFGVRQ